ncbi:hypothetical protein BD769DRAFT_1435642 [Suillus cothurnatus]|nr:hypothetical protein BD769DRAFT_1435642 [Suillus cothurnatus]
MAANIATPEFLSELQSLYPAPAKYVDGDWFLAASIAFSSSNCPEGIPYILLSDTSDEDRRLLVRKIRDGIFKSGLISGYLKPPPEELRDTEPLRSYDSDPSRSKEEIAAAGQAYFNSTYGDTAAKVQPMLRSIYPDLEHFTVKLGYGYVYAFMGVTSAKETSFAMISALIPNDTPRQVEWHLTGAVRNGATVEEVKGVREIALKIAIKAGVPLKNVVPDI